MAPYTPDCLTWGVRVNIFHSVTFYGCPECKYPLKHAQSASAPSTLNQSLVDSQTWPQASALALMLRSAVRDTWTQIWTQRTRPLALRTLLSAIWLFPGIPHPLLEPSPWLAKGSFIRRDGGTEPAACTYLPDC